MPRLRSCSPASCSPRSPIDSHRRHGRRAEDRVRGRPRDSAFPPTVRHSRPRESSSRPREKESGQRERQSRPRDSSSQPREKESQQRERHSHRQDVRSWRWEKESRQRERHSQARDSFSCPREEQSGTRERPSRVRDSFSRPRASRSPGMGRSAGPPQILHPFREEPLLPPPWATHPRTSGSRSPLRLALARAAPMPAREGPRGLVPEHGGNGVAERSSSAQRASSDSSRRWTAARQSPSALATSPG